MSSKGLVVTMDAVAASSVSLLSVMRVQDFSLKGLEDASVRCFYVRTEQWSLMSSLFFIESKKVHCTATWYAC